RSPLCQHWFSRNPHVSLLQLYPFLAVQALIPNRAAARVHPVLDPAVEAAPVPSRVAAQALPGSVVVPDRVAEVAPVPSRAAVQALPGPPVVPDRVAEVAPVHRNAVVLWRTRRAVCLDCASLCV